MTIKILDELERLQAAATPGPWARARKPVIEPNFYIVANSRWNWDGGPLAKPDADYLVKAMNTLPALIHVARAAEACRYGDRNSYAAMKMALQQLRALSDKGESDVSAFGLLRNENHERGTSE